MKPFKKMISVNKQSNKACEMSAYKILTACLLSAVCVLPKTANAQASACVAGETQQNFAVPAGSWAAGTLGPYAFNVGTGANAVTLTYSITGSQPFTNGSPEQFVTHGGLPNVVRAAHTTNLDNASLSTQTLNFSRPINKFVYVATDVDYTSAPGGGWQDAVRARANGTLLPTSFTAGAFHTVDNATGTVTATTNNNCNNNDASCNVAANFNFNGITSASEEFRTGPNHNGGQQFVGWTSFGFCAPNRSFITLRKAWVNATVGDTATVSGTGLTNLSSVANTANEIDTGAQQIVNAGAVINLSESVAPAAGYTGVLSCTGTAGLAGNVLTVGNADTDIVCTYTNTKRSTLTVTKTSTPAQLVVGATGQTYTITIAVANGPTTQAITIADALPAGITTSGAITATGGTLSGCPATGATSLAGCSIAAGAVNGNIVITVPVSVAAAAANPSTNTATVTGGGDPACTGIAPACTGTVSTPVISSASVVIAKTDNKSLATSGGTNAYIVTLSNQGPSSANGVVVTDTVVSGLVCPVANAVVCSVTGAGAVCPAGPLTIGNLTGAGITVAILPAGGALQFAYTCNVN